MRLIDADELIKNYLNHCRTEFEIKNCCMASENVLAIIQNAPTVERPLHSEWIPVSVQEPAVGGIYFVTAKHVSGHIGTDIARRLSDNVWTFGGEELKGTEIIAWMPLPEPYKEAENDI